jgi:hypothetical protein
MDRPSFVQSGERTLLVRLKEFQGQIDRLLQSRAVFLFAAIGCTVLVTWLRLVGSFSVPAAGGDYGHYLIAANWYTGQDRSGEGPFDPPVVPLLVIGLSTFFGRLETLQILGPIAAASLVPAGAFLLGRFVPRWAALMGATVFALWQTFTDLITYGGVTNLFGLTFSLLFLRVFFNSLQSPRIGAKPSRVDATAATLALLIVSTHHLTALVTGVTVLVWVLARALLDPHRRRAIAWTAFRPGCMVAAASVFYGPYLLELIATDSQSGLGRPLPISGIWEVIAFVWRLTPGLWLLFCLLGAFAFVRILPRSTIVPFAFALVSTPPLLFSTVLAAHPVRALMFEQFPIIFLACSWTITNVSSFDMRQIRSGSSRIPLAACTILLVVSIPILSASTADVQKAGMVSAHRFLQSDTLRALDWVSANTPASATLAVDGGTAVEYNDRWKGLALGWWVEGYTNRRAIYTANPALVPFQTRWPDIQDANRIFDGETAFEDGLLRVADSFPVDDGAVPMISTAYFGDYREFLGFAIPRLVNTSSGAHHDLISGAASLVSERANATEAIREGLYSGPGYSGRRSVSFEGSQHRVSVQLALTFESGSTWDAFEMTFRFSARESVEFNTLASGRVTFGFPPLYGYPEGQGALSWTATNFSPPRVGTDAGWPEEQTITVRWLRTGDDTTLGFETTLTEAPYDAGPSHPIEVRRVESILAAHDIAFLLISTDSPSNVGRFKRQPDRYSQVFANAATVVFQVL